MGTLLKDGDFHGLAARLGDPGGQLPMPSEHRSPQVPFVGGSPLVGEIPMGPQLRVCQTVGGGNLRQGRRHSGEHGQHSDDTDFSHPCRSDDGKSHLFEADATCC